MKSLKFEWDGEFYTVRGFRNEAIGHVEKVRVGRSQQWCLVSDDLSWWRPDCLRQAADFIDSLDTKAAPAPHPTTGQRTQVNSVRWPGVGGNKFLNTF